MIGLKVWRARYLSHKGEHARGLVACEMSDVQVLSRAGMHLSVLECDQRKSLEHAIALAHVGEVDASIGLVDKHLYKREASALLGFLASKAPDQVLWLTRGRRSGLECVQAFCDIQGDIPMCRELWAGKVSSLHELSYWLKVGKPSRAKDYFSVTFEKFGLSAPSVDWCETGLIYDSLRGNADELVCSEGPLISVILTAHNEERYLKVAIESLLAQTWRNVEIVIVDDASTDRTGVIADVMAASDSRIRVVHLPRNVGLWTAKNEGLKYCNGEFITMHDADDWSHPSKLERQVVPLVKDSALMATTSYMVRVDADNGVPFTRNGCNYLRWNPSSFMFRFDLSILRIGFLDALLGSDCEFIARLESIMGSSTHRRIRLPLSIGLQRANSLSNRFRAKGQNGLKRLEHWESWRRRHVSLIKNKSTLDSYLQQGQ